jgi:LCP family protein required for cell wall assembly
MAEKKEPHIISPKVTVWDPSNPTPTSAPIPAQQPKPKRSRKVLRYILLVLGLLIITIGVAVAIKAARLSDKIFVGEKTSFTKKIADLFSFGEDTKLKGEDLGQINILLIGIGGAGHDGGYLADTIMVAQIRPDVNKLVLSSIPRDYFVNLKQYGYRKINASFAEGYNKNKSYSEGGELARKTVGEVTGLDIPYFAVVDFKGFEQAIDLLGGVSVTIPNTFTDYTFPNENNGYLPPVTFKEGVEQMTGKRALIYARSRHAAGGEGSDFARSQRQQLIMQSVKQKVVELNLVSDAGKINQLVTVLGDHFHTNIQLSELFRLYSLTKNLPREHIIANNLDPSTKLICPKIQEESGAYTLVPCAGKTALDVQRFFTDAFDQTTVLNETSVVWLGDSTGGKLYSAAEKKLTQAGLTVFKINYDSTKPLEQSVYYEVNSKPQTTEFIKDALDARSVTLAPPGVNINKEKVDVVVILGGKVPVVESATNTNKPATNTNTPKPVTNTNVNKPAVNTNVNKPTNTNSVNKNTNSNASNKNTNKSITP